MKNRFGYQFLISDSTWWLLYQETQMSNSFGKANFKYVKVSNLSTLSHCSRCPNNGHSPLLRHPLKSINHRKHGINMQQSRHRVSRLKQGTSERVR